jgi:integrase
MYPLQEGAKMQQTMRKSGLVHSLKEDKDRFFYPQEYLNVLKVLNRKQRLTVMSLFNTGARINEMTQCKIKDMDLGKKRIKLIVTKCKAKKGEKKPRPRTIPISTQMAMWFQRYITEEGLKEDDYLGLLTTSATAQMMKKACKEAGIKDYKNFSAHNLRKTLETWLMALGVDGMKLVAHFGHDMSTACHHYVSPDIFTHQEKQQMRLIIGDLYE